MYFIELFFYFLVLILSLFTVFPFITTLISMFGKNSSGTISEPQLGFACVITGYKNVEITKNLVESILRQNYDNFHIYLVADNCDEYNYGISSDKLTVLFPKPFLNSKSKSIKFAIDNYIQNHEYTLILDPDNLIEKDFLSKINKWIHKGYNVIQAKRTAKNLDSHMARLDAMSDYYYNYAHRLLPHNLGLSATISGSGMVLKTDYYKSFFEVEDINQHIIAEDKMLQIYVVDTLNNKIAFAYDALVYDEKVTTGEQVQRQRTRWIASFFQYIVHGFVLMLKGIFSFNLNKAFFGYTIIIPPLFLLIGVNFLFVVFSVVFGWNAFFLTFGCFVSLIFNFFLCLMLSKAPKNVIKSVVMAPLFIFRQIIGLSKYNDTKSDFLVTEKKHSKSIDDILN